VEYKPVRVEQDFQEAWWDAELGEATRQLEEALDLPTAWTPAHLAWESATVDDLDDEFGFSSPSQRSIPYLPSFPRA